MRVAVIVSILALALPALAQAPLPPPATNDWNRLSDETRRMEQERERRLQESQQQQRFEAERQDQQRQLRNQQEQFRQEQNQQRRMPQR